jgi:hypothetical protein
MKNVIFWDIKLQFIPHRNHMTHQLESSRLMFCRIVGFDAGVYEESRILGCGAVLVLLELTFRGNISLLSSR